jgi:putative tryptophan/tyrosine transport system substrate-binding protein
MRRREFIIALTGAALSRPVRARAQAKVPVIGFLGPSTASSQSQHVAAFVQRLRELGWIEGHTITIEYRWADGHSQRFAEIAAEFVRLKVDIIVTHNTPPVLAAKEATSVIPIVFASAGDPVKFGIVASFNRPGGNVTGLTSQGDETVGKRVELLREVVPHLRRLAILGNIDSVFSVVEMREAEAAARALGLDTVALKIRDSKDITPAFEGLAMKRAEALYISADPLAFTNRIPISTLASDARLPTMVGIHDYVQAGCLMSYGVDFADQFRRAADYVDKILRGAKPAEMPVEQPTKFQLVINLKTAKALGITVPQTLLARADEVIE